MLQVINTTHQLHILKQNDYYKRKVLIIAVCISLHVAEIQLEAASSFTSGYVGDLFVVLYAYIYFYMIGYRSIFKNADLMHMTHRR